MNVTVMSPEVELSGLDGSNPLGFLAALGTLVTAHAAGEYAARLGWRRRHTWVPVLDRLSTSDPAQLSELIARALTGRAVSAGAEAACGTAQKAWEAASKAVKDAQAALRRQGLKGSERKAAVESQIRPLEEHRDDLRQTWLGALAEAAPRPELALGKQLNCRGDEFRGHASTFLATGSFSSRESLDLLAAFGSDGSIRPRAVTIEATPFCFITGAGHQYFLETAAKLMNQVSAERVRRALFEPWDYADERLSMRWDPREDRRYALMDRDPTAAGNEPRTVWMASLLGYRALVLFPAAPTRGGLQVTCWGDGDEPLFSWPIWAPMLGPDAVRSVLQVQELLDDRPNRAALRSRGIQSVFRARRIKVGSGANTRVNFTPARPVMT